MKFLFCTLSLFIIQLLSGQLPSVSWGRGPGGTGLSAGYATATDQSGNAFMLGSYYAALPNTVDIDPSSGSFPMSGNGLFVIKFDPNGTPLWIVPFPILPNSMTSAITPLDLACDSNGDVYFITYFSNAGIDFYYSSSTDTIVNTCGSNSDFILVKISNAGTVQWAHMFGNSGGEEAVSLECTGDGVYVGGLFACNTDFDPSDSIVAQPAIAAWCRAGFLAKYTRNGEFVWVKILEGLSFGDPGYARPRAMSIDNNDDIIISGELGGTVNFNPQAGIDTIQVTPGNGAGYFAKYDTNGTFIFVKKIATPVYFAYPSCTTDQANNIIVSGTFNGTVDADPGPGTILLVSSNTQSAFESDVFIAKYDPNGNHIWSGKFGSFNSDGLLKIICDPNDNILLSAQVTDTCDLDIGNGTFISPVLSVSALFPENTIIKYSPAGQLMYAFCLDGDSYTCFADMTYFGSSLYATGRVDNSTDFDPTPAVYPSQNTGYSFIKYVDLTIGQQEFQLGSDNLVVYPNPTDAQLHITGDHTGASSIYSISGALVLSQPASEHIDVSGLDPGIYLLVLTNENGMIRRTRFTKL